MDYIFNENSKLLTRDHGPCALVREDLQEERVRRPAVDDVRALHALRDGLDAALHLRDHTPRDHVLSHQVPRLVDRQRAVKKTLTRQSDCLYENKNVQK